MKKALLTLLILALICGGAYYCYDKYGSAFSAGGKADDTAQIAAIQEEALRMYPTNVAEREKWVGVQLAALKRIESVQKGLSSETAKKIRAAAEERYPRNYDRQLGYINRQSLDAKTVNMMLVEVALSGPESERILAILEKKSSGDYHEQIAILREVLDAYGRMKTKGADLPKQDFNALMDKAFLAMDADLGSAERVFNEQYIARHNYLTKTIPESLGDLREGIEEKYPADYVAQLEELNGRLKSALRGKNIEAAETAELSYSNLARKIFKKYIYVQVRGNGDYNSFFTKMNGRTVLLFPMEMLEGMADKFSGLSDVSGLSGANVFCLKDASVAMVVAEGEPDVGCIEFAPKAEVLGGDFNVQIIGLGKDGKKASYMAQLKNGKLSFPENNKADVLKHMANCALIVDEGSERVLGIYSTETRTGAQFYDSITQDRDSLDNIMAQGGTDNSINGARSLINANKDAFVRGIENPFDVIFCEDFLNWDKYSKARYEAETESIKKTAEANYWMCRFIMYNLYGEALESSFFSPIAKKYESEFATRQQKTRFLSIYAKYLEDAVRLFGKEARRPSDYGDNFYYCLKNTAKKQYDFMRSLNDFAFGLVGDANKIGFAHSDLTAHLKGDTYVPPSIGNYSNSRVKDVSNVGGAMTLKPSN